MTILIMILFNPVPCDRLVFEDRQQAPHCNSPIEWLIEIPENLRPQYLAVAGCESGFNPLIGDGDEGLAKGLFQIHWDFWLDWANREGFNGDGRFTPYNWSNPLVNAEMTYLIQEEYSLKRGQDRWHQWGAKPYWSECVRRADEVMN